MTAITDEQIAHLWDTRVGYPTPRQPITEDEVIRFAREVLALTAPAPAVPTMTPTHTYDGLFQDTEGTVPVTGPGQRVALMTMPASMVEMIQRDPDKRPLSMPLIRETIASATVPKHERAIDIALANQVTSTGEQEDWFKSELIKASNKGYAQGLIDGKALAAPSHSVPSEPTSDQTAKELISRFRKAVLENRTPDAGDEEYDEMIAAQKALYEALRASLPDVKAGTEQYMRGFNDAKAQFAAVPIKPEPRQAPSDARRKDALLQASIDFIGRLTGMKPPPIEVAPPDVFAPFHAFVTEIESILAAQAPSDALYQELLYAVSKKYTGESRHQTALRYIRQAEEAPERAAIAAQAQKEPKP